MIVDLSTGEATEPDPNAGKARDYGASIRLDAPSSYLTDGGLPPNPRIRLTRAARLRIIAVGLYRAAS